MYDTTVTRKYQITLPKKVREALKIAIGDRLEVLPSVGQLIVRKEKKDVVKETAGAWKDFPFDAVEFQDKIRHSKKLRELYESPARQ